MRGGGKIDSLQRSKHVNIILLHNAKYVEMGPKFKYITEKNKNKRELN